MDASSKPESLKAKFDADGFAVCRGFFSREEMRALLDEIQKAAAQLRQTGAESTDSMHFYHNLYRVSPFLRRFSSQPRIVELLTPLLGPSFWMRWNHAILKSPGGQEYPWHQDNAYSGLKDPYVQFWIAVTDCDERRGGLTFQAGSHKRGLLAHARRQNHTASAVEAGPEVNVEAHAGDVAVFSSFTLHRAGKNTSSEDRWVHILEYMSSAHFDPTIPPPYFQVARGGVSDPQLVRFYPGSLNPVNHLKYLRHHRGWKRLRRWIRGVRA